MRKRNRWHANCMFGVPETKPRDIVMKFTSRFKLLNNFTFLLILTTFFGLPVAAAQDAQNSQGVSQEEELSEQELELEFSELDLERYKTMKKAARQATVAKAANADATGNDPRVFSNKWMPYYRSTELENGLKQQTPGRLKRPGFPFS